MNQFLLDIGLANLRSYNANILVGIKQGKLLKFSEYNEKVAEKKNIAIIWAYVVLSLTVLVILMTCFNRVTNGQHSLKKLFESFDFLKNTQSLTQQRKNSTNESEILEFMRFFCITWICFCHSCSINLSKNIMGTQKLWWIWTFLANPIMNIIASGFYALDIFIFLGGLVNFLSVNRQLANLETNQNNYKSTRCLAIYAVLIIKRYLRIIPLFFTA